MTGDPPPPSGAASTSDLPGAAPIRDAHVSVLAPADDGVFRPPWRSRQVPDLLRPLLVTHKLAHPNADLRVLERAFDLAERHHLGQFRITGEPYVGHPVAVATILANLGMDTTTLAAALLHDTVDGVGQPLDQIRAEFGGEVALLVDGVHRLDRVRLSDGAKAETARKMVLALANDPRVLVIKLADRLHNMRTLTLLPRDKQEMKAKQTLEIFAPLAHRLGMDTLRVEFEELSFRTLVPRRHQQIADLVRMHVPQRVSLLRQTVDRIRRDLAAAKIKAEVTGEVKHLYAIYQKMVADDREFNDIYDLIIVRVLVDTVRDCYAALGVVHANWQPIPGRFKDYIAMPKFNMYQSLHTTIVGSAGKPVETLIRTHAMHRVAEFGIAAAWGQEEAGLPAAAPQTGVDKTGWLRQLLDWQREGNDLAQFPDALRFDLSSDEVYVFTPKGDVLPLPVGSTAVDLAYAVHTDVGHRCIGARVSGRLVPLDSILQNGDVVEIFTSKSASAGPAPEWIGFVKSPRARTRIRHFFRRQRREEAVEIGREVIGNASRARGFSASSTLSSDDLAAVARGLRLPDVASLYAAVGENKVAVSSVLRKLAARSGAEMHPAETATREVPRRTRTGPDPGVMLHGVTGLAVRLARCCNPIHGDAIFGFVTRSGGVSVHRDDCANAPDLRDRVDRVIAADWRPGRESTFLAAIQVEALDRFHLMRDVTRALSDDGIDILSSHVTTTRDRVAVLKITFVLADPKRIGKLAAAVRRVDGVFDAYRVTSGA